MLSKIYPEDLKVHIFTNLFYGCIRNSFQEGISWVFENCPEGIKVEVLGRVLAFSAIRDSVDQPLLIAQETFPPKIQQSVYTQALEIAAQQYNGEAVQKIANAYKISKEEKVIMHAQALANCTFLEKQEALTILIDVCSDEIKEETLGMAPDLYNEKLLLNKMGNLLATQTPIATIRDQMRKNPTIIAPKNSHRNPQKPSKISNHSI